MRSRLVLALLVLGLMGRSSDVALAQGAVDPSFEVPLYTGYVGLRTAATGRPTVRVYDPEGNLRIEVEATGTRSAEGRWNVQLGPPGDLSNLVLLQPGDRVEAVLGGRSTAVTVPRMTAEVDTVADTVRGLVPPTAAVFVQAHRDPLWYAEAPNPPGEVVAVGSGGRYLADLAGKFDLRPGTWGEVAMQDAAGHVFFLPFAVPAATLDATNYAIQVRSPAAVRMAEVALERGDGSVRFRSAPALAAGAGLFLATLFLEGRPEYGAYVPVPGDELVVYLDGQETLREVVPWVTTTVRLQSREVSGLAPPGAHVAVNFTPADEPGTPTYRGHTTADATGSYRLDTSALSVVAESAQSATVGYPGGSAAFLARGGVPAQTVQLYGHRIGGSLAGWGRLTLTHLPGGEGPEARAEVRANPRGGFAAELFVRGEPAVLAPGDRITILAERGEGLDVTIPQVTADAAPATRQVRGRAPPGAAVRVHAFGGAPDYFGNQQYEQPFTALYARADDTGHYAVECAVEDCGTRYGVTYVQQGETSFALEWLEAPLIGVGVTLADALAKATSGSAVTVTPLDAAGQPGPPRHGLVRPALSGGLPEWSADLGDVFPAPMAVGARVRIQVGERIADVEIPALTWQVSPGRDDVRGTGPPRHVYQAVAAARQEDRQPPFGVVSGTMDAAGRFQARFQQFDVRPGDDAELYLLRGNHYLWWTAKGVRDPEPEVTPTATASATATREPTALPTPRTTPAGVYLPYGARGARPGAAGR